MWCSHCQADVATEVSADGQAMLCTTCGEEIRKIFAPSLHPETRSARELLERWSRGDLLDPHGPLTSSPDSAATGAPPEAPSSVRRSPARDEMADNESGADLDAGDAESSSEPETSARPVRKIHRGGRPSPGRRASPKNTQAQDNESQPSFRIDAPHASSHGAGARRSAPRPHLEPQAPTHQASASHGRAFRRDDAPHELSAPHFDMHTYAERTGERPGRQESVLGQVLAYLGVAMLTVGAALVLWGYFGGPAMQRYAPTGWLISTAGQMLLFLGVVTLVSGGMQQTTHEVSSRVEFLGDRMLRIEQSTQEILKGPYFARIDADARVPASDDDAASV